MTSKENDKKSLIETEREFLNQKNGKSTSVEKDRQPDQQNHMKDVENLRK